MAEIARKRLPFIVGAVLGLCYSGAGLAAVVTATTTEGWEFSIDGNVNAFLVYENSDAQPAGVTGGTLSSDASSTRVRTGLLPASLGFNLKTPMENGLQGGARIGFYPQIQNAHTKNQFGSQIDLREAYATLDGNFGQLLAGRALSLFLGQNILTDMTLYGVGVQGGVTGGGTTLGRIGYGYVYPQFNAQFRYTTPAIAGMKFAVGLFDPSQIGDASAGLFATQTDTPRVEFELSTDHAFGGSKLKAWLNGMYQQADFAAGVGPGGSVTADGIGLGVQWALGPLGLTASGYTGKALGTTLLLDTDSLDAAGQERDNQGFLLQATYAMGPTTYGISYGESSADETARDRADRLAGSAHLDTQSSATLGVYHDVTSWFKLVGEYSRAKNDWFDGSSQKSNIVSVGTFFSF